jgi:uncharacterized protein
MNYSQELDRLAELHAKGVLTEEEFTAAKAQLLLSPPPMPSPVNRYQPPSLPQQPEKVGSEDGRNWAMGIHFSAVAASFMPVVGFAVPIVLWQIKRKEIPALDAHGKAVANWLVTYGGCMLLAFVLVFVFIGVLLLPLLAGLNVLLCIIGGLKAKEGRVWRYPGSFPIFG